MAMFDYKNYSSDAAAELLDDAHRLSAYTNASSFYRLPGDVLLNYAGDNSGEFLASSPDVAIPQGWKELTPADLGVSDDLVDNSGYFTIESQYTGKTEDGPQAKIFAEYDDAGNATKVNLNFSGTNSGLDVIDYLNLNSGEGAILFEPILKIVKDFTLANDLEPSDVLISGYSLGAGLTNVMAEERENLSDGFFTDSDYMAFEVPKIYDNADVVYNYGYENDVVHRIAGDFDTFPEAAVDGGPAFINPDHRYESSTDNLVLFNDVYASPAWEANPFSLYNLPVGWNAHIGGVTTDAINRIQDSTFYEHTQMDSAVIVSDLTETARATTWVRDKFTHTSDHYGESAFLIGTQYNDLIQGGINSDYIDAGAGDDIIRAGYGVDHVDGNVGTDELRVEGRSTDWATYKMDDGTLFFVDKDGNNLVEADNIESVSFVNEPGSYLNNYTIADRGLIDNRPLVNKLTNTNQEFDQQTEGTVGADELSGQVVFGRGGDDRISGSANDDVLHGGGGDDQLLGQSGDDRLFGAEGDDTLSGGHGNDQLIGGIGNDTFIINDKPGNDVIVDFNNDIGYEDVIAFSSELFSSTSELANSASQQGQDVIVSISQWDSVTIENAALNDVLLHSTII